jgi:phosphoenolpyruvate carboxykinase (GTP)
LGLSAAAVDELLRVDRDDWQVEAEAEGSFLQQFGDRLPDELGDEHRALRDRLAAVPASH